MSDRCKEGLKSIAGGLIWISIVAFVFMRTDYVRRDYRLIGRWQTAQGTPIEAWDDTEQDEDGFHEFYSVMIVFHASNSEWVTIFSDDGPLPLEYYGFVEPDPIEIEYDPDNPDINQHAGVGSLTVWQWIWSGALNWISALYFSFVGFILVIFGISEVFCCRKSLDHRQA